MLEDIPLIAVDETIYRLANLKRYYTALDDMELEPEGMLQFVAENRPHTPEDLVQGPFRRASHERAEETRFSDGYLLVFYGALELETAQREALSYASAAVGKAQQPRTVYYDQLRCRFVGDGRDLRTKHEDWPFLTESDDDAYHKCQQLAKEAVSDNTDGFLTPSPRAPGGTNTPIFASQAIPLTDVLGQVALTIDADTGEARIIRPA